MWVGPDGPYPSYLSYSVIPGFSQNMGREACHHGCWILLGSALIFRDVSWSFHCIPVLVWSCINSTVWWKDYRRQKSELHYIVLDASLDLWLPAIAKPEHFLLGNKHHESICTFIPNVSFLCRGGNGLVLHWVNFQPVNTKIYSNIGNQENCYTKITGTCTFVSPLVPK